MAEPVPLREAEAHLAALVDRAAAGEEVVISRDGRPVARLVALESHAPARRPGAFRGRIVIGEDFDAPLPDDIAAAFGPDHTGPGR